MPIESRLLHTAQSVVEASPTITPRQALVAAFRRRIYDRCGIVLFPHQAEWGLATEGWTLTDEAPTRGDYYTQVRLPDLAIVDRKIVPRRGIGHVARNCSLLAAYKGGKSWSAGMWAGGFAALPDARVQFVGIEYSTSEPEFTYLAEALISEAGMNLPYTSYHNDPRNGRMQLKLKNGATFVCMSWNQSHALKGKTLDAYIWTEAYQLPGFHTYNSLKQNLRQRRGYSIWVTTPDHPWVSVLHESAHGVDPDWHCTCGIADYHNPFTFDAKERDKADPEKGGGMTKEAFAIAHLGKLGDYIGKVYDFQRGAGLFTPGTHPWIFDADRVTQRRDDLVGALGSLLSPYPVAGQLDADRRR